MQCIYQQTLTHGTPDQCYAFTQTYAGTQEARVVEHQLGVILDEQIEGLNTPDQILALRDRYPNSTTVTAHCNKRLATLRYRRAPPHHPTTGTLRRLKRRLAPCRQSPCAHA